MAGISCVSVAPHTEQVRVISPASPQVAAFVCTHAPHVCTVCCVVTVVPLVVVVLVVVVAFVVSFVVVAAAG